MARLPIEVDSSTVAKAAIDLDALEAAAISAGYAVDSLADHTRWQAAQSEQMTAQIEREIAALLREEGVIRQTAVSTTQAMHGFRFGIANVAAQFQDIAVTSAMGMNAMTIGLQQGTQLSAVLQTSGGGLRGVAEMLREAFFSVISPVSLVTIGVVAATAATIQWTAANLKWGQSAEDMLDKYHDKLEKIVGGYKQAGELVDELRNRSGQLSIGAIEVSLGKSLSDAEKELDTFRHTAGNISAAFKTSGREIDQEFAGVIDKFLSGEMTASDFETEIAKAAATNINFFSSFDDVQLQRFASQLLEGAKMAKVYENALVDITHILAEIGEETSPYGLGIALESMVEGEKAAEAHKIELDAIVAKSPAQLADIARRREMLALRDEEISESLRQQKIDQAGAEAYASAAHDIYEANQQRLRSAKDNIDQARLELRLLGEGIEAATRAKFVRDELAAAEEAAAASGVSVSQEYVAAIQKIGAEYGKLQRQIAEQGAIADLLFARSQMGRSDIEANVASSLREIYGDDYESQMGGFIANQIRVNETLAMFDEIGQSVTQNVLVGFAEAWKKAFLALEEDDGALRIKYATDLLTESQQRNIEITEQMRLDIVRLSLDMANAEAGANNLEHAWTAAWTAMGDISVKILDQLANKALTMAANGIWDMIFNAASGFIGGGIGGGVAGTWGVAGGFSGFKGIFGVPGYADGVAAAPAGVAWVGERGPELMNFRGGESVTPSQQSMALVGGPPVQHIENHFHNDNRGAQIGFEERFSDMMDTWARNNLPTYLQAWTDNPTRVG